MGKSLLSRCSIPVSIALLSFATQPVARAQSCSGFTLLDFRSPADIALGNYRGWEGYIQNQPIALSYQFDDEFMDFLPPGGRDAAIQAVIAAMHSWSDSTHAHLSFHESEWVAVENSDSTQFWQWEGPSFEQWEGLGFPVDELPGWGANIDFFTKPVGFTITSGGINYQMTPGILGFAVIYRQNDFIRTADIYLNEAWTWTTNPALASEAPHIAGQPLRYACDSAQHPQHEPDRRIPRSFQGVPAETGGLTPVFDIQTVVLHELGHALGLDHPNEAQSQGGALIDPYTFQYLAGNCWQSASVMHGDYTGVKRILKPADIGGTAFLYIPALPGDLNASGDIDPGDAFEAIQSLSGDAQPSPYDVNIMDFVERDGVISDVEAATVVQWAFDGVPGAGVIPAWNPAPLQTIPSVMIVTPMFCPPVMVPGSTVTLALKLDNPSQRNIRMWTIEAQYNPALLVNPRLAEGSLFSGAIWITPEQEPGRIRFARISLLDEETDPSGTVVNLEFDVLATPDNPPPKPYEQPLTLTEARILVSDPVLHVFGDPDAGETLVIHPPPIIFADLDVNNDGRIGTEDWYAFLDAPTDFNGDLRIDNDDEKLFLSYMRQSEIADVTADIAVPAQGSAPAD